MAAVPECKRFLALSEFKRLSLFNANACFERCDQFFKMVCVYFARVAVMPFANCGGHSDHFAHHATRSHYSHGTERFVRDTDIAA